VVDYLQGCVALGAKSALAYRVLRHIFDVFSYAFLGYYIKPTATATIRTDRSY
jgi:hypothetical protein